MDSAHSGTNGSDARDNEFLASITPNIMVCLAERRFFETLDNRLCPNETSDAREFCNGNYELSESILRSHGFGDEDIADIFAVLGAQGGFCDCEVLYNVVESSRLKAEYWRAKAEGKEPPHFHGPNRSKPSAH
jgi:hypothetical protein